MELTQSQMEWIEEHKSVFAINSSAIEPDRIFVYDIYNSIFGTNKKPNSCGRCWRNVKSGVYQQYLKQKEI